MRTLLLLLALISILSAADINVGDVKLVVPTCDSHLAIATNTKQFSFLETATPPINRFLYVEAPPAISEKANANEVVNLDDYNVIQSFRQAEFMEFGKDLFIASREEMANSFRKALKPASWDEIQESLNARINEQQGGQAAEIKLGAPRLVGDIEVTDDHLRFTMMMDLVVGEENVVMICRGTVRPIRNRMVFLFSYKHYKDQGSLAAVEGMHATFVERLLTANLDSLTIPGAGPEAPAKKKPSEPVVP